MKRNVFCAALTGALLMAGSGLVQAQDKTAPANKPKTETASQPAKTEAKSSSSTSTAPSSSTTANQSGKMEMRKVQAQTAPQTELKPPYPYDETKAITLPSGLKYVIVEEGTGALPEKGKPVTVHYHGLLTNGNKFDSSFDRNQPFSFTLGVGQVIKGWDEGIAKLKKGTKAVLIVPPSLGYGDRAMGSAIPANSTLIFHVFLPNPPAQAPASTN